MLTPMKTETLLWGLLPAAIAVCAIVLSLYVAAKARRFYQYAASGLVVVAAAWSLLVLYATFVDKAWPTLLPHIAIAGIVGIVAAQALLLRSRRQEVA